MLREGSSAQGSAWQVEGEMNCEPTRTKLGDDQDYRQKETGNSRVSTMCPELS